MLFEPLSHILLMKERSMLDQFLKTFRPVSGSVILSKLHSSSRNWLPRDTLFD